MSKEVLFDGWISQIPDEMYDNWVKLKYIKKGQTNFIDYKFSKSWKDFFQAKFVKKMVELKPEIYEKMHLEVNKWYAEVFSYVTNWLKTNKYIKLKKGSFNGGFCAVSKEDETTKGWGAPLSAKGNKVAQIKEKFGAITVYFDGLTEAQKKDIGDFEIHVVEKFDCVANFN